MPSVLATRIRSRREHKRLRALGLRPVVYWLPDVDSPEFARRAHEASLAVARSPHAAEDQDWVESVSDTW